MLNSVVSTKAPDAPWVVESSFVAAASTPEQCPPPVSLEIAFAGRSNVGKSSLMNGLMSRRGLVRTSSKPGCTRQLAFFSARLRNGWSPLLVDLPGYGYARRSKTERKAWGGLLESYLLGRPSLAATVLLVDARRGPEQEELDLLELLAGPSTTSRRPVALLVVATKLDKLNASEGKSALARIGRSINRPVVGFSTQRLELVGGIWRALLSLVGPTPDVPPKGSEASGIPQGDGATARPVE